MDRRRACCGTCGRDLPLELARHALAEGSTLVIAGRFGRWMRRMDQWWCETCLAQQSAAEPRADAHVDESPGERTAGE